MSKNMLAVGSGEVLDALNFLYGAFADRLIVGGTGGPHELLLLDRPRRHLLMAALDGPDDRCRSPVCVGDIPEMFRRRHGQDPRVLAPVLRRIAPPPLTSGSYVGLLRLVVDDPAAGRALTHLPVLDQARVDVALALPRELVCTKLLGNVPDKAAATAVRELFLVAVGVHERHPRDLAASLANAASLSDVAQILERAVTPPLLPCGPSFDDHRVAQITSLSELRGLGAVWKNCLRTFSPSYSRDGDTYVYAYKEADAEALFSIERDGRHGYVLKEIRGRENLDVGRAVEGEIKRLCAHVGITRREKVQTLLISL